MKNIRQKIFEKCFFGKKRHCLTQIKVFFFLLLFGNISLMAQNFVVKGKVLDANNEPLIGAAVVLKSKSTLSELWQILMVTLHWKYLIRMQCLQSHIWV